MKVKVHALVEMEINVDEKFAPLKAKWDYALIQELADIISNQLLTDDKVVELEAVFDETGEECWIEY